MNKKMDNILNPTTTDLDKLKNGARFAWGRVIMIHEIGSYAVVEAMSDSEHEIQYHSYIDGRSCAHAYPTLDAALAGCIAYKHEGCNHRADWYFIKMIQET